jgi:hypothetical protein
MYDMRFLRYRKALLLALLAALIVGGVGVAGAAPGTGSATASPLIAADYWGEDCRLSAAVKVSGDGTGPVYAAGRITCQTTAWVGIKVTLTKNGAVLDETERLKSQLTKTDAKPEPSFRITTKERAASPDVQYCAIVEGAYVRGEETDRNPVRYLQRERQCVATHANSTSSQPLS